MDVQLHVSEQTGPTEQLFCLTRVICRLPWGTPQDVASDGSVIHAQQFVEHSRYTRRLANGATQVTRGIPDLT
eukprot:795310-Amphidinium_carterae.1